MDKNNKMLIDATHPEETRVVVLRQGRVEEFDYESASRKLLRGNIYLAKVTRVEPSLQAAFVDYGGNRHGFLAFNEIHPDYYQIPVADRQALLQEEAEAEAQAEEEADAAAQRRATGGAAATTASRCRASSRSPSSTTGLSDTAAEPAAVGEEPYLTSAPGEQADEERHAEPLPDYDDERRPARRTQGMSRAVADAHGDTTETAPEQAEASEGGGVTEVERPQRRRARAGGAGRHRGCDGGGARAPAPARALLQDPGGHQAPPDHPRAGRQGGARQQGRRPHHLSVAGRPLHGADAEHRARRRHLAQDHQRPGPQDA